MSPIQDLKLTYTPTNEEETFSEGDTVAGAVTFTLTKPTKVKSVVLKVKGDARVEWSEGTGDDKTTYSAHRRYFKVKDNLAAEGTELPEGVHHFKFRHKIPEGEMPSSFKGLNGKIVYMLEAKISRSWRLPSGVQAELNFVSKSSLHHDRGKCPQTDSLDKNVGIFSKGHIQLTVTVDRKVCSPGDTLLVVAKICNSSSKKMRPKFSLQQRTTYRASGSSKTRTDKSLCKMAVDVIRGNSEETVSCPVKIPVDAVHSLLNCDIISVEHYLKVYLDISFAPDPELRFPLVIVPSRFASLQPGEDVGPYPAGPVGAPSYSDFPAPAFCTAPYPASGGPGPYGYPPLDPTGYANSASGSNNLWNQYPPYGLSNAAFPPPAPTAPRLVQQEPPTYTSLFSDSDGTYGGTWSDLNTALQEEKK